MEGADKAARDGSGQVHIHLEDGAIRRDPLISTGELAKALSVRPQTILDWLKQDRIQHEVQLPGGAYRWRLGRVLQALRIRPEKVETKVIAKAAIDSIITRSRNATARRAS